MRAFLFDVDSTLVDTGGAGRRAFAAAVESCTGLAEPLRDIRLHGRTDRSILREALRPLGAELVGDATWQRIIERYLARLAMEIAASTDYRVLPGVPRLLAELDAARALLGLATGNVEAGARIKIERGGLRGFFGFGGFGDRHELRAELVASARREAEARAGRRLRRHEVFVVGDSELDVAAALESDCVAVAVATGRTTRAELAAAGADFVFESLEGAWEAEPFRF